MKIKQKSLSNILLYKELIFNKYKITNFYLNEMLNKYLSFVKDNRNPVLYDFEKLKLAYIYNDLIEYDELLENLKIKKKSLKILKNRGKIAKSSKKIIKKTFKSKNKLKININISKTSLFSINDNKKNNNELIEKINKEAINSKWNKIFKNDDFLNSNNKNVVDYFPKNFSFINTIKNSDSFIYENSNVIKNDVNLYANKYFLFEKNKNNEIININLSNNNSYSSYKISNQDYNEILNQQNNGSIFSNKRLNNNRKIKNAMYAINELLKKKENNNKNNISSHNIQNQYSEYEMSIQDFNYVKN